MDSSDDAFLLGELSRVLKLESQALFNLSSRLGDEWVKALRLIYACKGRLVVSGIGKSGIIAKKIAATLASTGTPAFFMHPSEALHGDLGMVTAQDVVLVLSKSGESEEVNAMLAAVRRMGAKVIALTSNPASTMSHVADIVLDQGDPEEACPYNLAPTSSTTLSLAAGDALAVALMHVRHFSQEDFALRHPGGRLGKRLLLLVRDVMLQGAENPVASIHCPMPEFLSIMAEKYAGAVSLVDASGKLAGLVTDHDLRKILQAGRNPLDVPLIELMNPKPIVIDENEKAFAALCLMQGREKPITVLPVVNASFKPVGMLRLHDLVGAGL